MVNVTHEVWIHPRNGLLPYISMLVTFMDIHAVHQKSRIRYQAVAFRSTAGI